MRVCVHVCVTCVQRASAPKNEEKTEKTRTTEEKIHKKTKNTQKKHVFFSKKDGKKCAGYSRTHALAHSLTSKQW